MINYIFEIDLKGEKTKYSDVVFTSGDKSAARFVFCFKDGNEPIETENLSLCIKAKRADGVVITDSGFDYDGRLCADIKNSMTEIPGELSFEIALTDETGAYVTTCEIITYVREGYGEAELEACDTTPILATLSSRAIQAEQSAKQAEESAKIAETSALAAEESAKLIESKSHIFIVDAVCNTEGNIEANKTYEEISTAFAERKFISVRATINNETIETAEILAGENVIFFMADLSGMSYRLKCTSDNEWSYLINDTSGGLNNLVIDSEFNFQSENPVQNKVIAATLGDVEEALEIILAIQNSLIGGEGE